jgi:hypothetical protein
MVNYLKKQFVKIILLIFTLSLFFETNTIYCVEYEHIGNDSIKIINNMMSYHLFFLKHDKYFESITFKEYNINSFKIIYDSLCKLYIPFNHYDLEEDIKVSNEMRGLSVAFTFIIDSNTLYNLWIFIPDNIYRFDQLIKSDVKKKLYKLNIFGILAFKDSIKVENLDIENSKKPGITFYKEYHRALKKLYQRNKKAKSP